jgi:hypothetical protein
MKTFTLKFYLKKTPNAVGKCPVYARIVYDRRKCEISTGIKCKPEEFSESSERFLDSKFYLNKRLSQIQGQIYAAHTKLTEKDEFFTVQDIKALLVEPNKSKIRTLDFYNQYIEDKVKDGHESKQLHLRATVKNVYQFGIFTASNLRIGKRLRLKIVRRQDSFFLRRQFLIYVSRSILAGIPCTLFCSL